MTSITDRKAALLARKAALTLRLQGIDDSLGEQRSQDWEDLATEREGDEVLEGMGQAGLHEIRQIEQALHRIETGTYGVCVRCGEAIAPARLDAVPWAPLCAGCAA